MRAGLCMALLLVACLAGLTACGETADQRDARQTVSRFYDALRSHDAKTACGLLSASRAQAMLRASGEGGKPCVAGLRDLFHRVATGANPDLFDVVPDVKAATVRGDRAVVVIEHGFQRRSVSLTREGADWRITVSPGAR